MKEFIANSFVDNQALSFLWIQHGIFVYFKEVQLLYILLYLFFSMCPLAMYTPIQSYIHLVASLTFYREAHQDNELLGRLIQLDIVRQFSRLMDCFSLRFLGRCFVQTNLKALFLCRIRQQASYNVLQVNEIKYSL